MDNFSYMEKIYSYIYFYLSFFSCNASKANRRGGHKSKPNYDARNHDNVALSYGGGNHRAQQTHHHQTHHQPPQHQQHQQHQPHQQHEQPKPSAPELPKDNAATNTNSKPVGWNVPNNEPKHTAAQQPSNFNPPPYANQGNQGGFAPPPGMNSQPHGLPANPPAYSPTANVQGSYPHVNPPPYSAQVPAEIHT